MSTIDDITSVEIAGGSSQNLILFMRGKAISGDPKNIGTSQFPNPPIIIGITMKKIITKAWAVTMTLYSWSFWPNIEGWESFIRMITLIEAPTIPDHTPKIKYMVPISLWFVDIIHRIYKLLNCKFSKKLSFL